MQGNARINSMTLNATLIEIDAFVVTEFHKAETAVENWWHDFTPILAADFQKYVAALKPLAWALVQGLATALASYSGLDKLAIAAKTLAAMAGQQGLSTSITFATTLIQQIIGSIGAAMGAPAAVTAGG
jgi:hypothetical protein